MICPSCTKPYYFISREKIGESQCLRCEYHDKFVPPDYVEYHDTLYNAKPYTRTQKTDPMMRRVLRGLDIQATDVVYDIGCGVGDYTKAVSLLAPQVTGIDLDTSSAARKYPDLKFISQDINDALPLPSDSADKIVCIALIEHLVDYDKLLTDCRRILKPGGTIAVTSANLDFFLHDYYFDKTHLHEWTLTRYGEIVGKYFTQTALEKCSGMFNYYPWNIILTKFLLPDTMFIGTKD